MMGDNQSCLSVLESGFPNGSHNLRLRFHALEEGVKAGDMVLVHVSSDDQFAQSGRLDKGPGRRQVCTVP
jgi:hypothetical protein